MLALSQYFIKTIRPAFSAVCTRLIYWGNRVKIGKNFRTDGIPRLIVDKSCFLEIGDNVEFRRSVEIRVHGRGKVVIRNNVRIDRGVRLLAANESVIDIGDGARIGLYSVLNGGDSIVIGRKSLVSGFVYLQTSMHGFKDRSSSVQEQGYEHAPVTLEEDTWLGTHVVVMPGITISKGAVVGSNAVVNKNVEQYQVVAGVPAKPISERK